MLRVRLLGGLGLEVDGQAVRAPAGRCGALLAWLALHPGMQPRARVAARLWPDVLDESARRSLRTALLDLRRDLGPDGRRHLIATRDEVGLGPSGELWVDAQEFSAAAREGRLPDALALGGGELLPEFEHEWVYTARDEHRHALEQVISRLASEAEEAGDLATAVERTRQLVALDPLAEAPVRELIRRLAAAHDRAAALTAYERHRERLRTELGVAPSSSTRALVDTIRAEAEETRAPPGRPPVELPVTLRRHAAKPLFGRTSELAALRGGWSAVLREQSLRCIVLAGESGIGKTRLLADLCATAHRGGAAVLYGRCHENAPFPYAPVAEALRRHAEVAGPSRLSADAGAGAAQLARLVPQLAVAQSDRPAAAGGAQAEDADAEALTLFDAIASVLTAAARPSGVVLALEDVQWADRPTLRVLEHLARAAEEAPVLVVATHRDTETAADDALTATLARLRRARVLETVPVGALATPALVELARACRPGTPAAVLDEVLSRTDGNPYFVEEFLRDVEAVETAGLGEIAVPETVQDLIVRRFGRLGDEARSVVAAASVIGLEFDVETLELVTGSPRDALLDPLDEALAGGVLGELPRAVGGFAFTHALVRETLHRRLSATRRAHLHGRVACAIEQRHGDAPDHVAALARHHELAGDTAGALRCHLLAGAAAAGIPAADDALDHFSHAIDAAARLGLAPDDARVYGARHRRALLRQQAGDLRGAVDDAEAAIAGAREAQDADAELAARNRRAFLRRFEHVGESIAANEEALRAAERSGDVRAQAGSLGRLAIEHASQLRLDDGVRLAGRALDIAERAGDDEALALALDAVKFTALQLGDLETLEAATSRLLELRDRAGTAWQLHWLDDWVQLERAFVAIAGADWETAIAGVRGAIDTNRRLRDRIAEPVFLDALTWIHRSRGEHEAAIGQGTEALELARELGNPEWLAWNGATLGWALLEAGDPARAAAPLTQGLAAAQRVGARAQLLRCTALLSWATSELGDRERAGALAAQAEGLLAETSAPPGRAFLFGAHAPLAIARVHLGAGSPDRAEALVAPVLAAARAAGWRETVAYATLLDGAARGDCAAVEQALQLARRDGLQWVEREAGARLRALTAARR